MKILKVLAVGVAVVGVGVSSTLTVNAAEWKARTVDQIKADIAKTNGKEYTIVWGDTLSGISQATNITVGALAQRNSIENVDLIFAGNKLIFDGNVVTVQNNKGETVAQTVIKPEEKVDPNKNIGEAVDSDKTTGSSSSTNQGSNNSGTTTSSTTGDNTSNSSTNTTDSTSNSGNTGGSTGNTGGSNTGESNTGGSSSNTGDTSTGGSNGGTGETTEPSTPEEPTIVSGYVGNSGKVFGSAVEANTWANGQIDSGTAEDNGYSGYKLITIFYSDGSEKFSIDWY
ncbi:LysM peptidoglycan-binding domain-containing protein [Enterococcus casseliflavus]|uniref:LysM peptidoglycan-binding domain-containing protein n=1 Tax=Enterococcus casseliflavus TaxID=37734 RepID=UPI003DA20FA0